MSQFENQVFTRRHVRRAATFGTWQTSERKIIFMWIASYKNHGQRASWSAVVDVLRVWLIGLVGTTVLFLCVWLWPICACYMSKTMDINPSSQRYSSSHNNLELTAVASSQTFISTSVWSTSGRSIVFVKKMLIFWMYQKESMRNTAAEIVTRAPRKERW